MGKCGIPERGVARRNWCSGRLGGDSSSAGSAQAKPSYTLPEYNAFQAATNEKDPQARIKALDDFVAKYPMAEISDLLQFTYKDYYPDYFAQKNYPQTDYVDKLLALGDKIAAVRLKALVARAKAFYAGSADKALQTPEQLTKAKDAATQGLATLSAYQKPANMTDEQFAQQKKTRSIAELCGRYGGFGFEGL